MNKQKRAKLGQKLAKTSKVQGKNSRPKQKPKNKSSSIGGNGKQISIERSEVPVSFSSKVSVKKPRLGGSGRLNVTHAEFLSDVTTDVGYKGGFNVMQVSINPGLAKVFPWLSNIARNFQEYQFKKLTFYFVSECSSSTAGQFAITASYDPSLPAPSLESDFSNYEGMITDNVWKNVTFDVSPKGMNSQLHYYVRGSNPNTVIKNEDIKLLDCANVYLAYTNAAAATSLGKVWVEYSVDLLRPFSNTGYQQTINTNSFNIFAGSSSKLLPFGSTSTMLSSISGKFTSGNWSNFCSTNTWIALEGVGSKFIKTGIVGGTVTSGLNIVLYQYTPSVNDDGNIGFSEVVSDPLELMNLADTGLSGGTIPGFTNLSTSANIVSSTAVANSGATGGTVSYALNIPSGCVILINATGNCNTITDGLILVTDIDFSMPNISTFISSDMLG